MSGATVTGSEVRVEMFGFSPGPAAVTPYERFVDLGRLRPGSYDLYIDVTVDPGALSELSFSCGPISQEVVAGQPIPGLGRVGGPLLAALLAVAAFSTLRRIA